MKRKAVALIVPIFGVLLCAEISAAGGSRHLGHSIAARGAGGFRQSGGFRASIGGSGFQLRAGGRSVHRHHFGQGKHFHHKKDFTAHRSFGHRRIISRHGLHGGFFFGHRIIGVPSSSVVIRSHPRAITPSTVPRHESVVEIGRAQRPLITIMLDNRHELGLSPEQVEDLENLRDEYQREAIRYEADIRIAEIDLQKLLKAEAVDLEQIKVKLQEIEHLKVELRLARIRAIEQGKALLSPEQHGKLQALLGQSRYSQLEDERSGPLTEDSP
jgi:Spy/CpxP family protein refolding chaperone